MWGAERFGWTAYQTRTETSYMDLCRLADRAEDRGELKDVTTVRGR